MNIFKKSYVFFGTLFVIHANCAMEPEHNQKNDEVVLQKKFAVYNNKTQESWFPDELQLNIASFVIGDFLCDSAKELREYKQLGDSSYGRLCLAKISHNDEWLVTVCEKPDDHIYVWDMQSAQLSHTFADHDESICSLEISPNDEYLVVSLANGWIKTWNMKTRILEHKRFVSSGNISLVEIAPDSSYYVTLSATEMIHKVVQIWDMKTGDIISKLENDDNHCIASLVIAPGGKQLVTAVWDGALRLWDVETGKLSATFAQYHGMLVDHNCMLITCDGTYLITPCDKWVRLWNMETGKDHFAFGMRQESIKSLFLSSDNKKLTIMTYDGLIEVWDMSGQLLYTCKSGHEHCSLETFAFDKNAKKALQTVKSQSVEVRDMETSTVLYTLPGKKDLIVNVLTTNSDGSQVVIGSSDKTTKLWSLKKSPALLWLEKDILPFQAHLIARVYAANKNKETFKIKFGTDDMLLWVSLPSHVRDYLNLYLQIELVSQIQQMHQ